jgi:hypothetical protein
LGEYFFLVEKPGLDIAVIEGMVEAMNWHDHVPFNETN